MFLTRRIAYCFKNSIVSSLPHQITTIYRPQPSEFHPPNSRCLLPAVAMGAISAITGWTDINSMLTAGLTGLGLFYYAVTAHTFEMKVKQIDASQDFSKLYIHFNGGWSADRIIGRVNKFEDRKYSRETGILEIPTKDVSVGSFLNNKNIDYKSIYLKLHLYPIDYSLPIGPLNLQTNLEIDYRDHLKNFCQQRHEEGII